MLLIDPGRGVASARRDAAPVPYVLKEFRGRPDLARAFLTRYSTPSWLLPAVVQEIGGPGEMKRLPDPRLASIVIDVARWIAEGSTEVAVCLSATPRLIFRVRDTMDADLGQGVRFSRRTDAVEFLRGCLRAPAARTAIDAAIAGRPNGVQQPPADEASLLTWLADQLMFRRLGLFPDHDDLAELRLVWIRHSVLTTVVAAAAAPPPPAAASQIVQSAPSTMPDLPDEVSPQAQTMIDAAADGAPFCEECARAAAAAADA